jgi:hypothetical protein
LSIAALQLPVARDHASDGEAASAGDAVVTPVCRTLAKRIGHGAIVSLPPNAPTETGVTEGEGEAEGMPVPPTELDELGVRVDDGERLGETVGEGDAEKGASAYSLPLSENTTVLSASMGEPVMGCAAGVV